MIDNTTAEFQPKLDKKIMKESVISDYKQAVEELDNENEELINLLILCTIKEVYYKCLINYLVSQGVSIKGFEITKEDVCKELYSKGFEEADVAIWIEVFLNSMKTMAEEGVEID